MYQKIYSHFNLKDIYNNINHEDENSEEYKKAKEELDKIQIQTLTNILVVKTKMKDWKDIIEISDKALELEPENIKALFFRGRALLNLTEYEKAIEIFNKILSLDKDNTDAVKELARAKKERKAYEDKCKALFKFK